MMMKRRRRICIWIKSIADVTMRGGIVPAVNFSSTRQPSWKTRHSAVISFFPPSKQAVAVERVTATSASVYERADTMEIPITLSSRSGRCPSDYLALYSQPNEIPHFPIPCSLFLSLSLTAVFANGIEILMRTERLPDRLKGVMIIPASQSEEKKNIVKE